MITSIEIVPASPVHVGRIANRMRAIDRQECEASGHTAKQALRAGLMRSSRVWTALVDGKPEAMFGVVVESVLSGEATPWFLGTDEVYRHGRALLMWGPGIIDRLHDSRFTLRNLVSSHNRRAIRLLEKWGFEISADEQEIAGTMFRQFVKEPS